MPPCYAEVRLDWCQYREDAQAALDALRQLLDPRCQATAIRRQGTGPGAQAACAHLKTQMTHTFLASAAQITWRLLELHGVDAREAFRRHGLSAVDIGDA